MPHNSVIGKLVNGGNPNRLSREIVLALAEAGKFGYEVIFKEAEDPPEELTLTFVRKSKKQVLVMPGYVWRYRGGIRQAILDDLRI
jgi:hypothetical protein